jgi:hypothetical protein
MSFAFSHRLDNPYVVPSTVMNFTYPCASTREAAMSGRRYRFFIVLEANQKFRFVKTTRYHGIVEYKYILL